MNFKNELKYQYSNGGNVQKIIIWTIISFVLSLIFWFSFSSNSFNFPSWISVSSGFQNILKFPWTVVTYMFFHANLIHLILNLLMLHFVARFFLTFFTERQLIVAYFFTGILAAVIYSIGFGYFIENLPLVGASASIIGLLVATTVFSPNYIINLALIGKIKLWYIPALILFIDFIAFSSYFRNSELASNLGGHFAHLAGAFSGFLYAMLFKNGFDLSKIGTKSKSQSNKSKLKKVYVTSQKTNLESNSKDAMEQRKVDEILDKISKSGYDSLSKDEKEFLFKLGK